VVALLFVAGLTPGTRAQSPTRRVLLPMGARDAAPAPSLAGTWEWPNARPIGGAIRAVAAPSESVAWVVGDDGAIARTTDGGATWSVQRSGPDATLYGIGAATLDVAWAVDEGRTWSRGSISADPNFIPTDVAALTADAALVAGFVAGTIPGEVYRTTNGGASWTRLYSRIYQPLQSIAALSATTLAVGGGYDLNVSIDAGATWVARCPPGGCATADLAAGASALWASSGGTLVSTDAGASWTRTGPSMQRFAALSERSAWAVRFDQIAHFRD